MKNTMLNCIKFIQSMCIAHILVTSHLYGQVGRAPANFVPDDDMIVVPLNIQGSLYEDFNRKYKDQFSASKQKMEFWISQEQYAEDYGLEDTGFIVLPTEEEKKEFLKRNYLRFISRDIKRNNQQILKEAVRSWSSDDEIDAIREQEEREKFIVRAKKNSGGKDTKALEARVKVGKQKFKLRFQPRLEMGMLKIKFSSEYINFQAWLGANGTQEIKFEKYYAKTGTRGLLLYYIDETRILAAMDQNIYKGLNFRYTHEKDIDKFSQFFDSGETEINTVQLRFTMGF